VNFPYPEVYEFFARPLIQTGLDPEPTSELYVVRTDGTKITELIPLPVAHYFADNEGKAHLGRDIQHMLGLLPPDFGMVLIHEVWTKTLSLDETRDRPASLENAPGAIEAVAIFLYHGDELRLGTLPIAKDRSVSYCPLNPPALSLAGRLTANADDELEHAIEAATVVKDALDKARGH
jgi:hypothetical protein